MPGRRVHKFVSRLLLGKSYNVVHREIDRPYLVFGRKHRQLYHTPLEAFYVGSSASLDPGAGVAGVLHVWADRRCSKEKWFKDSLKFMERQDRLWRKQMELQKKHDKRMQKSWERFLRSW